MLLISIVYSINNLPRMRIKLFMTVQYIYTHKTSIIMTAINETYQNSTESIIIYL